MQHCRHACHRFRIPGDKLHKRIVESEEQEQAIESVVDSCQVAILLFIEHHESVVLFDEVIIGPQRRHKEEHESCAGQYQHWPNRKEQQRSPKQTRSIFSFSTIEISAREGAENVWRVNQY